MVIVCIFCLLDRNVLPPWIRRGIQNISAVLSVAVNLELMLAFMNETDKPIAGLRPTLSGLLCNVS